MPLYCVDAFTDAPFGGNPAGVCVLDEPAPDAWMQRVAAELRHSETAFLSPAGPGRWALRWFTPTVEVDLCGHATLASAHALWSEGHSSSPSMSFVTASGELTASRHGDATVLDFPWDPPEPAAPPAGMIEALGVAAVATARARTDWLVEVDSEAEVRAADPDVAQLGAADQRVIVTARADGDAGYDIVSRYFAPSVGIDEDPVTGAAHCVLGPYWSGRLGARMVGYQASARGGIVGLRCLPPRVLLEGRAVTVWRGELAVDPA